MRFSIIMPVLNEAAVLERQLARLCTPHECELLIVDGGSDDQTVAIAQRFGKVIHAPRGRAMQMNAGATVATGDVLIFLHADTLLPRDAFSAIEQALTHQNVVGGAFRLCFNCHQLAYRLVSFTANLRSRFRGIFTGDQAYFVRASSFKAIGGFPNVASARRHQKVGLLRSVFFMWYMRTLYKFGASPERLQRKYLDVR